MRKEGVLFLSIVVFVFVGSMVVVDARLKQQAANLESPVTGELQARITRMYEMYECVSPANGPDVAILSEVLIDMRDYHINKDDRSRIEAIYGKEAIAQAGYLTAMKAYYAYFRTGYEAQAKAYPPPGDGSQQKPTATLPVSCPASPDPGKVQLTEVSSLSEKRAVVRYEHHENILEAVLRKIDGQWMITSVRMIENRNRGANVDTRSLPNRG